MIDELLSRKRIDRKVKESDRYIGRYDLSNGIRISKSKLIDYFSTDKAIDIETATK